MDKLDEYEGTSYDPAKILENITILEESSQSCGCKSPITEILPCKNNLILDLKYASWISKTTYWNQRDKEEKEEEDHG